MATFHRKKKSLKKTSKKRVFGKTAAPNKSSSVKKTTSQKPTSRTTTRSVHDAPPATVSEVNTAEEKDASVDEISRFIKQSTQKLKQYQQTTLNQPEKDVVFDGLTSDRERFEFLEQKLQEEQRKSHKLEHQLSMIKAEFNTEKESMEKELKNLKKELHRTAPIAENKFFSLSKELRTALSAIEEVSKEAGPMPVSAEGLHSDQGHPPLNNMDITILSDNASEPKIVTKPENDSAAVAVQSQKDTSAEPYSPKKASKLTPGKKKAVTATVAIVMFIITSAVSSRLLKKPEVDQALVDQYIEEQQAETGIVAGSTDGSEASPAQLTEYQLTNDPVSFDDTIWEKFFDPMFGLNFQYPANAANLVKTDSSATFSRKGGYIFKVQRIETGLEIAEYWQQIQSTSYEYEVEETEFSGRPALHLVLQEEVEIPGNRYIVQGEGTIYDIWYATESEVFSSDDIQRAQKMISSVRLINQKANKETE